DNGSSPPSVPEFQGPALTLRSGFRRETMSKPKKKSRYQSRTPISWHQKKGKVLQPPFVQFGMGKGLVSWMNDRLPEMIWAALLISALGREAALKELREFLRFVWENPDRESLHDCTLTGFANLEDSLRSAVIGFLC